MAEQKDMLSLLNAIEKPIHEVMVGDASCPDPIFTWEDINKAENDLARIARYYIVKNNIGQTKFKELFKQYVEANGIRCSKAENMRGNIRNRLKKETMTWDFFAGHLMPVLGLSLEHLDVFFIDRRTNELIHISSLDTNDHPPADMANMERFAKFSITATDGNNRVTLNAPGGNNDK